MEATAAVTTAVFVMWCVHAVNDVVAIGATAYVSQLIGAGDRPRAGLVAFRAVRASALLGLAVAVAGLAGAPAIAGFLTGDEATRGAAATYLAIVLAGAPFPMLALTCEGIFRAAGNTRLPLLIETGSVAINAVLDPILIYGVGGWRGWGIAGAAWATVVSQALLVAGYAYLAARRHPAFPLERHAPGRPVTLRMLARVGLPAAMIGMLFSAVYLAFSRMAGRLGAAAMAVVGVANRIEAIQFMISFAIGQAGGALVGQSLGARRPERAEETLRTGLRWNLVIGGTLTALFLAFPEALLGLFTPDPEAMRLGTPYLRVLGICLIFNGIEIVTAESIIGSGHTKGISAIFTIVSILRIPLAALATGPWGMGVTGIAWVITVTCVGRALIIYSWALRGKWKEGLARDLHGPDPLAGPPQSA